MASAIPLPVPARSLPPSNRSRRIAAPLSGVTRADSSAIARISRQLERLREAGRRAVSIVDLDCGDGALVFAAGRKARMLGFVAIIVQGFDRSGENVRYARRRAAGAADPAIGYTFQVRSRNHPLPVEDSEADILLLAPGEVPPDEIARIVDESGAVVRHK